MQPAIRRLAAEAQQEVLDRHAAHAGDLDLQPLERLLEPDRGQHVLQRLDHQAQLRPRGSGRSLLPASPITRGAARRSGRRRGEQPGDPVAAHAVDAPERVHALARAIATAWPPSICEADFQPSIGRIHRQVETAVLRRRQAGVRAVAVDALLLVLLRAVRGQSPCRRCRYASSMRWRAPDRSTAGYPGGRRVNRDLHRPARRAVAGLRERHGEVARTAASSSRRSTSVHRPAAARCGHCRFACRLVEPGDRPGDR